MPFFKFGSKPKPAQPPVVPAIPIIPTSGTIQKSPRKTLTQLENELEALHLSTSPHKPSQVVRTKKGFFNKLMLLALLVGIPVGIVSLANVPVPGWRSQVGKNAPILLFPTYSSWDNAYKEAITNLNQAEQLINRPTSAADLDLGGKKLTITKDALDKLPTDFIDSEFDRSLYWYSWYYSRSGFYAARSQLGTLESKLFQERNAQILLGTTEATINQSKLQYQEAKTSTDKQLAASNWKESLSKITQISIATLAGRTAQQKFSQYQKDFQETVGLFAGNAVTSNLIVAAQQFAWQAAKDGQNPPHQLVRWQQITGLWQEAIARLQKVPPTDLGGYPEAQRLMAQYQANLSEIQVRLDAERNSVMAFEQAQREITLLISIFSSVDRNRNVSQLQSIINRLEKVQLGTTPYLKAQELLVFARKKLQELR